MPESNIDEYLQQGMYGPKETKPDERRKFLGTLRERVVIVLTQEQVRESGLKQQVVEMIKSNPKAHLFLNGNMDYTYLSKYTKIANKNKVQFTMVSNKDYDSELGLVLAYDYAVDKEDIYINEKKPNPINIDHNAFNNEMGFFSKLKKAFGKG